jgi:glycosyltransferase involved in cell wall biosynthesis
MTDPAISVVIPCYNIEKWLPFCLDSLLAQTERNWQAICVDDASTDNTASIIEKYVSKDIRFQCVRHETNKGVSGARNTGLQHVKAELVTFIDSDDWYAPTALTSFLAIQSQTNADLVRISSCNATLNGEAIINKWRKPIAYIIDFDNKNAYKNAVAYGGGVVWAKCFRMEIIRRENLAFKEDLSLGEDNLFSWEYFFKCKRIAGGASEHPEIFHRKREDSLYNSQKGEFLLAQLKLALLRIHSLLEAHGISEADCFFYGCSVAYFKNIRNLQDISRKKMFLQEIRQSSDLHKIIALPIFRSGNWRRKILLHGLLRGWTWLFPFWRSSRKK